MENKSSLALGVLSLAFLLALIQVHHIFIIYSTTLNANIDAAVGVTTGHPHWRVYQNRILGPYLLKGLAGLFSGGYTDSYTLIMIASLTLAGHQAWRIGKKLGGTQTGWFALVLLHLAFVSILSQSWLYLWDFIGLNVFLAFVDFVISERPWYWFLGLFAVAILNRDSAQLIALWMILEPTCRWLTRRPLPGRTSLTMVSAGIICIAVGRWIIDFLRTSLLVEEVGFKIVGGIPAGYGPDFFWNLPTNLMLLQQILHPGSLTEFVYSFLPLAIFIIAIYFVIVLAYRELRYLALAMIFAVSLVLILLFGSMPETRVFMETIPLVILGSCLLIYPGALARNPDSKGAA